MKSRQEIFDIVRNSLIELFELDAPVVVPEARFDDDLEIDSIDAVDLLDRLKRRTGCKFAAEDFRAVRTVGDLVQVIEQKLVPA